MPNASLKDAMYVPYANLLGTRNLTLTGLTVAGTPSATAVFKTANTTTYMIDGRIAPTKAATDNIPMSSTGPNGLPVYAQPAGTTVYYPVLIDFAGNITTMQGDVNGPITTNTMLTPATAVITGISISVLPISRLAAAPLPGSTPTLQVVTPPYAVVTITSASHGLQTGDTIVLTGVTGNNNLNGGSFKVTVSSSSVFTLDNVDPNTAGTSAGVTAGTTFTQVDAARACIGVIKILTGTAAFTPNTTTLAAGIASGGAVTWLEVSAIPLNGRP